MTRDRRNDDAELLVPDGRFRPISDEPGSRLEVALSHNGRQVAVRSSAYPEQVLRVRADAWLDFIERLQRGEIDPIVNGDEQ